MKQIFALFLGLLAYVPLSHADKMSALEHRMPAYIDYELELFGLPLATARLSLQVDENGHYIYQVISKPAGLTKLFRKYTVVERSEGKIVDDVLIPSQWSFIFDEGKNPPTQEINFDWDSMIASGVYKGKPVSFEFPTDVIDRAVTQPSLVVALQSGANTIDFVVADKHRVKKYEYQTGTTQTISTKLGNINTIKVSRMQNGKPHKTTLWCAPEYDYIPVKAKHTDGGLSYVLKIKGISKEYVKI